MVGNTQTYLQVTHSQMYEEQVCCVLQIEETKVLIRLSHSGLDYYHSYFQGLLLCCVSLTFMGWIAWLLCLLLRQNTGKSREGRLLAYATLLVLKLGYALQASAHQDKSWSGGVGGGMLEAVYNNLYTGLILIHLITYFYKSILLIQLNQFLLCNPTVVKCLSLAALLQSLLCVLSVTWIICHPQGIQSQTTYSIPRSQD